MSWGRPQETSAMFVSPAVNAMTWISRSLAVGSVNGYKLYSLTSSENLEPIYENGTIALLLPAKKRLVDGSIQNYCIADSEEVVIAERLFSSSLVALVSVCAPRKLRVCHFKKGTEICNYSYASKILSVKMNRSVNCHETNREIKIKQETFPGWFSHSHFMSSAVTRKMN